MSRSKEEWCQKCALEIRTSLLTPCHNHYRRRILKQSVAALGQVIDRHIESLPSLRKGGISVKERSIRLERSRPCRSAATAPTCSRLRESQIATSCDSFPLQWLAAPAHCSDLRPLHSPCTLTRNATHRLTRSNCLLICYSCWLSALEQNVVTEMNLIRGQCFTLLALARINPQTSSECP